MIVNDDYDDVNAVPSRSLVLPLNQSALSVTWACTSTATSAPPPMYAEPYHAVSLHCDNFDIYVDTSPTTAFVLSLFRLSTPGSTTATSCLSGFLSTSNDAYRPYSMLQHVWCFDFVATTTSLTPYVDTSPMTAFVLSLSHLSTPGSTTETSCLSGFLSTSNDAYSCSTSGVSTSSLRPRH